MMIALLLATGIIIIIISIKGFSKRDEENDKEREEKKKKEQSIKDVNILNDEEKIRILQTAIEKPTDIRLADYEKIEVTKDRINLIKKGSTPPKVNKTAQNGIVYLVYPDHIEYTIEIETAIEVLATIWQKHQEKSIALDELAILWRDLHQPKLEQTKDISEQITYPKLKEFYIKYILPNVLYAEGYKKVIDYVIMKLLEYQNVPSVMYGIKEEYRSSDEIARLQFISLIDHTINVCEILMSRVEAKDKGGPIAIAYIILGLFHDIGKIPTLFKTIGEKFGHAAASSFDFKDIARVNLPDDFFNKIDEAISKHHTEMESGRNIYYDMLVSADREARRREFSFIQRQIDMGEIVVGKDGKYRLKSELKEQEEFEITDNNQKTEEPHQNNDDDNENKDQEQEQGTMENYDSHDKKEQGNDSLENEEEKVKEKQKEKDEDMVSHENKKKKNIDTPEENLKTEQKQNNSQEENTEGDQIKSDGFGKEKNNQDRLEDTKDLTSEKLITDTDIGTNKKVFEVISKKHPEKTDNENKNKSDASQNETSNTSTLHYDLGDTTYIKREEMAFNNELPDKSDDKITLNKDFKDEFLKNFDFSSQDNKDYINSFKTILNKHINPQDLLYGIVNHINYSSYKETKTGERVSFVKSIMHKEYIFVEYDLFYELLMETIKEKGSHDYYYLLDSVGKNEKMRHIFSSIAISIIENNIKKCLFDEKNYPQCLYKVKFKNTNKNLYDVKMWVIRNFVSSKLRERIESRKTDNTVLKRLESMDILEKNRQGIEVVKFTINLV